MHGMIALAALVLVLLVGCPAASEPNLNPKWPYVFANPPHGASAEREFRGEFFELLGPEITTRYSEVAV